MATLPSPRQLLTSLLGALTTTPSAQSAPNIINEPYPGPSNPLKTLLPSQRPVLTTLHVLFPPPMLLQALDLLDRGLVLRVIERTHHSPDGVTTHAQEGKRGKVQAVHPPQANIHLSSPPPGPSNPEARKGAVETGEKMKRNAVYQVRSSQPPKPRFRDGGAATGSTVYTVRLEAWNCSCAAFAFSAFPGTFSSGGHAPWNLGAEDDQNMDVRRVGGMDEGREEQRCEFGGLSFDGREDGSAVPVCKHLIACLLGQWWDVLDGYVREREVGREEMGGLGGEGY